LPLLVAWFAVAYATHRFVPTWIAGVTLGVVVRMIALGHYHWDQLTFLLVALIFVGLIAWPVQWLAPRFRLGGPDPIRRPKVP
jgi:hypothetical protein